MTNIIQNFAVAAAAASVFIASGAQAKPQTSHAQTDNVTGASCGGYVQSETQNGSCSVSSTRVVYHAKWDVAFNMTTETGCMWQMHAGRPMADERLRYTNKMNIETGRLQTALRVDDNFVILQRPDKNGAVTVDIYKKKDESSSQAGKIATSICTKVDLDKMQATGCVSQEPNKSSITIGRGDEFARNQCANLVGALGAAGFLPAFSRAASDARLRAARNLISQLSENPNAPAQSAASSTAGPPVPY